MKKAARRVWSAILVLSFILCMFTGCSNSNPSSDEGGSQNQGDVVELTIGHIGALESPSNLAVEYFIDLVEERSNGSIHITNYPASQLGADREMLEGILAGTLDMGIPAAGISALFMPEYYIFDCPYMFTSDEHLENVVSGELGQRLADQFLERNNVRVLTSNWKRGTRQSIFKNEVTCFEDYKGVKIRLPEIDSYVGVYEAFGAKPAIITFNETYSSLSQGIVDGMECPLDWIYDNAFYEVCKHLVMDNHVYSVMTVLINEDKFQTLTPEQQEILTQASIEAGEYQNEILAEKESEYLENMEAAGVTIYEPDITPFVEAAEPVIRELCNEWGEGLYEEVASYR